MEFKELLNFIDFVKNPESYEAQLTQLREEQQRLQQNIEATVKLDEVNAFHAQAAQAAAEGQKVIDEAKDQAAGIIAAAKTAYDTKLAELDAQVQALAKDAANAAAALQEAKDQAKALKALKKSLEEAQGAVILERQALATAQADVDARLEKLKAVMG